LIRFLLPPPFPPPSFFFSFDDRAERNAARGVEKGEMKVAEAQQRAFCFLSSPPLPFPSPLPPPPLRKGSVDTGRKRGLGSKMDSSLFPLFPFFFFPPPLFPYEAGGPDKKKEKLSDNPPPPFSPLSPLSPSLPRRLLGRGETADRNP